MNVLQRVPIRFRLSVALVAFLLGILLGSVIVLPYSTLIFSLSIGFLGGFLIFRSYRIGVVSLALAMLCIGYGYAANTHASITLHQGFTYEGAMTVLSVKSGKNFQQKVLVRLEEGERAGNNVRTTVYDWGIKAGTGVTGTVDIQPSDFRYDKGANIIGTSRGIENVQVVNAPNSLFRLREKIQIAMGSTLPEPYASLALGLVTGMTDGFDADFKEDLQRTGTTHLVAVSGYNLTIVALLLQRVGLRWGRRWGLILSTLGILSYVLLAGGSPSILRGAVIALLSLSVVYFGRVSHRSILVLIGASILSLMMPLGMAYNLSWQLSMLGFIGIVFLSPILTPVFAKKWGNIGQTLGETLSAQVFVLPILLINFGTLSIISPIINVIVLGITPVAMGLSALHGLVSLLSLDLGRILAFVTYPVLWAIVKPIEWGSSVPFASIEISHSPLPYYILSFSVVVLAMGYMGVYERRRWFKT